MRLFFLIGHNTLSCLYKVSKALSLPFYLPVLPLSGPSLPQSLMMMSTGQRLRFARDFLAERLKLLVAKSALSQLGD